MPRGAIINCLVIAQPVFFGGGLVFAALNPAPLIIPEMQENVTSLTTKAHFKDVFMFVID